MSDQSQTVKPSPYAGKELLVMVKPSKPFDEMTDTELDAFSESVALVANERLALSRSEQAAKQAG